ncbi:hypothetical protein [Segetibacter aerophilus]|uniref:Uncharacterized protein n=1 Tax=Segetibacter aerophilus TaxID=670293 RepID=A0A512BHT5_9BACT|nr:hypothetical protein [Segetibacter aerophilus]GEO11546.1 hypothetical protein SAE01_40420 [Segetibacter aerophilus]
MIDLFETELKPHSSETYSTSYPTKYRTHKRGRWPIPVIIAGLIALIAVAFINDYREILFIGLCITLALIGVVLIFYFLRLILVAKFVVGEPQKRSEKYKDGQYKRFDLGKGNRYQKTDVQYKLQDEYIIANGIFKSLNEKIPPE